MVVLGYVDQLHIEFTFLLHRNHLRNHLLHDHLSRLVRRVTLRHRVGGEKIHHDVQRHLLLRALQHLQQLDLLLGNQAVAALAISERDDEGCLGGEEMGYVVPWRIIVIKRGLVRARRSSSELMMKNGSIHHV